MNDRLMNDRLEFTHPSSFRDPSGFVFVRNETVLRKINPSYFSHYSKLKDSGLYDLLTEKRLLIAHEEIDQTDEQITIKPEQIDFFTYPYEWCFSQLKDAAIATLTIQLLALKHGMTLKDASAFNICMHENQALFIDSLSFEEYAEGQPWSPYGQFCSHFLCPLLLWSQGFRTKWYLGEGHLDGADIELTSKLLPLRTYFSPMILTNVHLHARSIAKHSSYKSDENLNQKRKSSKLSKSSLENILKSLLVTLRGLDVHIDDNSSQWSGYYSRQNYNDKDFECKEMTIKNWIDENGYQRIWDIGANDGHFSRTANNGSRVIYPMPLSPARV